MRSRDSKLPPTENEIFDFPAFLNRTLCDTGLAMSDSMVTKSVIETLQLNLATVLMKCGLLTAQRPELYSNAMKAANE